MDFLPFVEQARTCRRFYEDKPLSQDDLTWLVRCARATPSARNAQVVRFVLITGKTCAQVFPNTHWAMALKDWKGPVEGERPTAFLGLVLPKDAPSIALIDLGIVAQTVQLAAHSRGYGSCIIKSFDKEAVSTLLSLDPSQSLELVVGLGVALEKRGICPIDSSGSLNYFRDAEGTHWVPKRSVEELICGRFS
ncbi:MAG: nitroreductase family protein [Desulfovibrio sp.]|nr:nitroreductase family protein [Desulfovibrio sp.]